MDKNTLSNYGWIVIAVLVLSVMIALATPFGNYVEMGVRSATQGLFDTSEKAMNVVGMSAGSGNFENGYQGGQSESQEPQKQVETFKLDDEEYQYEVGMTWGEWVKSKYNTGNFSVFSESEYREDYQLIICDNNTEKNISYSTCWKLDDEDALGDRRVEEFHQIIRGEEYWMAWDDDYYLLEFSDCNTYYNISDNDGKVVYNQTLYTRGVVEEEPKEEPETQGPGATFSDGTFLTWDELQMEENGDEYMYDSYAINNTSIGDYAFADCSSLVSIVLPNTITIIGERAFAYTSLTVAPLIPKSVQYLDACIFSGCDSITEVRYDGTLNEFSKIKTNDWIDEAPISKLICTDVVSEHFFGN